MTTSAGFDRTEALQEIRRIVLTYPEASDTGDLAGVGRFMGGVRFGRYGLPEDQLLLRSAEEAGKQYGESVIYYPDGTSHAKHLITNVDVAFSDDARSADARSTYVVLQATPELSLRVICTGGYEDTVRYDGSTWTLAVRREWMDIKDDLRLHVFTPDRIEVGHGPSGVFRRIGLSAADVPVLDDDGPSGVDRALAVEQIRRIILTYPERVDRGDFAGVGRLLAGVQFGSAVGRNAPTIPDSELRSATAEEIEERYRAAVRIYEDGLPHTKHLITNIDVWFADDMRTAHTRSYYTVLQGLDSFPLQIVISGRYEDAFELASDGWRLSARLEYADLIGDLTHHVSSETLTHLTPPS